jgi:hypothetical protein
MQQNDLLNNVLAVMARSLLQYAMHAGLWITDRSKGTLVAVDDLIAGQSGRVQQLSNLLDGRRWTIDFGEFPDFTDLHYLSLEFVLPHLVENERSVVQTIESAQVQCTSDDEGAALLGEILAGERATLAKLEELARSWPTAAAQTAA